MQSHFSPYLKLLLSYGCILARNGPTQFKVLYDLGLRVNNYYENRNDCLPLLGPIQPSSPSTKELHV